MYRLIVVDDNILDRNGIKTLLDWTSLGIEVVGMYSNGKQAFEDIENSRPDIILSDISMPVMNGLEMVKKLRESGHDIKTIFLSCHDEFNFAKSALSLDVEYYVLKPIIAEELYEAILKVLNKQKSEERQNGERLEMLKAIEQSKPLLIEQFFREMLLGHFEPKADLIKKIEFLGLGHNEESEIRVISMKVNDYENSVAYTDIRESYVELYSIKKAIKLHN